MIQIWWAAVTTGQILQLPYSSRLFHLYLLHRLVDWHRRVKPDPDCRCLFAVLQCRSIVPTFRYRALFPGCRNHRRNPKLRHHSGRRNGLAWIPRARVSQTLFIYSNRCSLRRNPGLVARAHHRLRRLQRGNRLVWFGRCLRQHDRPLLRTGPDEVHPRRVRHRIHPCSAWARETLAATTPGRAFLAPWLGPPCSQRPARTWACWTPHR